MERNDDDVSAEQGKKPKQVGFARLFKRDPTMFPWRVATIVLLFVSCGLIYYLISDGQDRQEDLLAHKQTITRLQNEVRDRKIENTQLQDQLEVVTNPGFERYILHTSVPDSDSYAWLYWNPESNEVFLDPVPLPEIERGNQYQLWAEVRGNTIDLGTVLTGDIGFQQMKNVANPSYFIITLEPLGGNSTPTTDRLIATNKNSQRM